MHFLTESVAIGGLVSCELPRDFRRLRGLSQAARAHSVLLTMVRQLQFRRRYVTDRFQQRRWLSQSTHSRVAYATVSSWRRVPRRRMTSGLSNPMARDKDFPMPRSVIC